MFDKLDDAIYKLFGDRGKHTVFLKWLVYIVCVIGAFVLAGHFGLLATVLFDKSFLCFGILAYYAIAEVLCARIHILNDMDYVSIQSRRNLAIQAIIPEYPQEQKDALARRLDRRNSFIGYAAGILLTLGLIGTVAGIAVTLWPFLTMSAAGVVLDIAKMQPLMGEVFAHAAIALLPSVYALVLSLFLSVSERLALTTKEDIMIMLDDQ